MSTETLVETGNVGEKMDLKQYIRSLGEHLMYEPEFDTDSLFRALDMVTEDIEEIRHQFSDEAPPGLEVVRDFMLESLELYRQSVDNMKIYVSSQDTDMLDEALSQSEEAENIIEAIDLVIQEHRNWLNSEAEA